MVCLLPSNKTKVDVKPKPRKFTLVDPWVEPEVNESTLFSAPELIAMLAVMSATVDALSASIVSLEIISTGEAPSVGLPLIYEPVTTTSSTDSSLS